MGWRGRGRLVPMGPGVTTLGTADAVVVIQIVQIRRRARLPTCGPQPSQSLVADVVIRLVGITVGRGTSRVLLLLLLL